MALQVRSLREVALSAAVLLSIASSAQATAIYQYTGNPFESISDNPLPAGTYTTAMSVSGVMMLNSPLAPNLVQKGISPTSFMFSDGRNAITDASPGLNIVSFTLSTDADGNISFWDIMVSVNFALPAFPGEQSPQIGTENLVSGGLDAARLAECVTLLLCTSFVADSASVLSPGTWTLIPEPSTALLLAAGLAGLAQMGRRPRLRSSLSAGPQA